MENKTYKLDWELDVNFNIETSGYTISAKYEDTIYQIAAPDMDLSTFGRALDLLFKKIEEYESGEVDD